jgi:hypothetical protein
MTDLSSLIARLEKAEGPSYSHDVEIAHLTGFWPAERIDRVTRADDGHVVVWFTEGPDLPIPLAVTSSIDAAVALVQRVLPGWGGLLSLGSGNSIHVADLWSERRGNQSSEDEEEYPLPPGEDAQAEHASLPMAICLATLRALQQKGSSNG